MQEHGVVLREYSDEILDAAWTESNAYLEEQAAANSDFDRVCQSWKTHRDMSFPYAARNELSYARFAFPKVGDVSMR